MLTCTLANTFSLYVSLLFHKRYSKKGRDTEQQFHRAWYAVSLTMEWNIWKRFIYLIIIKIYFFVHAWGSMRNQEFHKGVDGLKSLGTPDLDEKQFSIEFMCTYNQ